MIKVGELYVSQPGDIYFLVTNTESNKYDVDGYLFVASGEDIKSYFYKKASLVKGSFSDCTLIPKEEACSKLSDILSKIAEYHYGKYEEAFNMINTVVSILNAAE